MRHLYIPLLTSLLFTAGVAFSQRAGSTGTKQNNIGMYWGNPQGTQIAAGPDILTEPHKKWIQKNVPTLRPIVMGQCLYGYRNGGVLVQIQIKTGRKKEVRIPLSAYGEKSVLAGTVIYADGTTSEGNKAHYSYAAYDLENSKMRWKIDINVFASPVLDNDTLFIATGDKKLIALNPGTGKQKWSVDSDFLWDHLLVNGKTLIAYGIYNEMRLKAFDVENGDEKWETQVKMFYPICCNDMVVGLDSNCMVAYDVETGERKWTFTPEKSTIKISPFTAADGTIYVGLADEEKSGYLAAVSATDGKLKWKFKTGEGAPVSPVAGKKAVYFLTDGEHGNLFAVKTEDGALLWKSKVDTNTKVNPWLVVNNGTICFAKGRDIIGMK